jgi:excisionase family DNA binding protein
VSDRFLSVSEAARELGVSARRVRQLIEDEELSARRIGNSWAIPWAEIVQRRRHSPGAGRPYEKENIWLIAAVADAAAYEYAHRLVDDPSLLENLEAQQRAAFDRLSESILALCQFPVGDVVDNPEALAELRKLLSRASFSARREELLAGWIQKGVSYLRASEVSSSVNPYEIAQEWLDVLAREDREARGPRSVRSIRNMLVHRLGLDERNIAALRSRFDEARSFYAHPSFLVDLISDRRLVLSGPHAAAKFGIDLVPGDSVDAYVSAENQRGVVSDYQLVEADSLDENVLLRVVDGLPEPHPPLAPRLCVGADLLEDSDPRCRDAGSRLMNSLLAALSIDQLSSRWKYGSRA